MTATIARPQRRQSLDESAAMVAPTHAAWFGLGVKPPNEVESERKYRCDPALLPEMPKPWVLVQGYNTREESIRLIPARHMAFARLKIPGTRSLSREKWSERVDYALGRQRLLQVPKVAVKERYLVRDEHGRAWLIDHILTGDGAWIAESELQQDKDVPKAAFCQEELTDDPVGYTATYAVPLTTRARLDAIEKARKGLRSSYTPSEDPDFRWQL